MSSSDKKAAQKAFDANEALVAAKTGDCATGSPDIDVCNGRVLDAQSRTNSANSKETLGFVGIGVGAAVLVTGVVILATGESAHRFDAPTESAKLRGPSWAFGPGPGQLGLGLVGSF